MKRKKKREQPTFVRRSILMQHNSNRTLLGLLVMILAVILTGCSDDNGVSSEVQDTEFTYDEEFNTVAVKDYGKGTGTMTWSSDTTWILDGFVFVNEGQTLTIEPGTVIKGRSGQGANASALIIARGGTIMAQGTAEEPIIFTSEFDDLDGSVQIGTRGLWGGVIILGEARINTAAGEGQIEGIPSTEPRGAYGGNNDTDNSGVFTYVSIRYGGTDIGEGNEINGLTMGAVGSETTIHHVEVFFNHDDGFEWFGGTVNTKYLISAFNLDDCFDYDEGFRGMGQYWFSIQAANVGDRAGEHDGGTTPEDGTPYAIPEIRNVTYIGTGAASGVAENLTFMIRDNAGGKYYNSIFTDFADAAIEVEDLESGQDSKQRLDDGDLVFSIISGTAMKLERHWRILHPRSSFRIIWRPIPTASSIRSSAVSAAPTAAAVLIPARTWPVRQPAERRRQPMLTSIMSAITVLLSRVPRSGWTAGQL